MCVCVCIFKLSTIKQQKKESRARAVTHARTHTHAQSIRNPIKILHYREKHIVPLKKRKKIIKKTNECSADFPKKKIHETRNKTTRKENKRRKRERENGERIVGHHHHRKMNENVLSWRTEKNATHRPSFVFALPFWLTFLYKYDSCWVGRVVGPWPWRKTRCDRLNEATTHKNNNAATIN